MVVPLSDPSIDPITGLPVLNPSGPVQQIPLGQEVFPYADLNATAQPTRGPIYGDDIIPTSSLITAPDFQMKPRSVQATTTRELRVREAVFQNLGAAIPDGTTAPVDVNVVSGGGGGASPIAIVPYDFSQSTDGNGDTDLGAMGPIGSTIFGYVFSFTYDAGSIRDPNQNGYVRLTLFGGHGSTYNFYLASIAMSVPASGTTDRIAGEVNKWLYPGISFPLAQDQGDGKYHLYLQEVNIGGGNMTLNIWQNV